ncbi:MAG: ATP-binding cassette domain-containing protein, partial [Rhizobiales bacterium]|nr:ATP-binding cassette domain-containing protein [Hyphomicrobiales bacterium]
RRIFPHLTVEENIAAAMKAVGAPGGQDAIERCFARFPMLGPLRKRFGNQLSGGQQQMLAVARGLAAAPKLLLLDEPTEGLAPIIVDQMARALNAFLDDDGAALLLSEQNLRFARKCARHVYVLDSGRFVFQGDWRAFDANPEIKSRYLAV